MEFGEPTKPPQPFSFENKLDINVEKATIPTSLEASSSPLPNVLTPLGDVPALGEAGGSEITRKSSKERAWSIISTDHSLPAGSALCEDRISIPEHLKEGGKPRDSIRTLRTDSEAADTVADRKVTPEIMAQMKKLEALQKPFRDSQDGSIRMSGGSSGSSEPRLRGDSALFDEKQLEYMKQHKKQHQLDQQSKQLNQPTSANEDCSIQ